MADPKHLSGGEATGDQSACTASDAAKVSPEFRADPSFTYLLTNNLVEAEKEILRLKDENAELTKALTGLTCGGSEFFIRRGDRYVADIDACVSWVRRARDQANRRAIEALHARNAAEAENEKLRAALEEAVGAWRPIETAPKDGTTVLLFCPRGDGNQNSAYRVTCGDWLSDPGGTTEYRDAQGRWLDQDDRDSFEGWISWDGGFSEETMMPTHWRPLPPPPGGEHPQQSEPLQSGARTTRA